MAGSIIVFLIPLVVVQWNEAFYQFGGLNGYFVVEKGETYRLLTSLFLHVDMIHIVMNMISLYMVGTMVEKLFTPFSYLAIYFISALFGSFASIYMHPVGWAVGASGAIFGLFGALAGFAFVHRNTMKQQFMSFMRSFGMILLLNLGIGLLFPSVDMSAHIGGLVAGVIGGFMIANSPKYLWSYVVVSIFILVMIYSYFSLLYVQP